MLQVDEDGNVVRNPMLEELQAWTSTRRVAVESITHQWQSVSNPETGNPHLVHLLRAAFRDGQQHGVSPGSPYVSITAAMGQLGYTLGERNVSEEDKREGAIHAATIAAHRLGAWTKDAFYTRFSDPKTGPATLQANTTLTTYGRLEAESLLMINQLLGEPEEQGSTANEGHLEFALR